MKSLKTQKIRDGKRANDVTAISASQKSVSTGNRKIGYVRVSTDDQNLHFQRDAMREVGCDEVREEKRSGDKYRPVFEALVGELRRGDTLVVWKADRAARSALRLLELVEDFEDRGIGLTITTLGIDVNTPSGRAFFTILAAIAELELSNIRERAEAGRVAARARGIRFGRRKLLTPLKLKAAERLLEDPDESVTSVARTLGVGRATLYRSLAKSG